MFQPLQLAEVTFENRAVLTPGSDFEATDGRPHSAHLDRFVRLGRSAPGLILTDPLAVSGEGRITPGSPGLYTDAHRSAWAEAIERVSADSSAQVGARLLHAGRRAATRSRTAYPPDRPLPAPASWEPIAPSPKPYLRANRTPREMDQADMERVREEYVAATERADDAGFDLVSLHAGHGYLLSSFLSPLTNDREDEYGGSFEARLRFPLSVVEAVRDAWPETKPLGVTLNATDWQPGGIELAETYEIARRLRDRDVDILAVVAGQTTPYDRPEFDERTLAQYSEWVRNVANVPTLAMNYATSDDDINTLIAGGRADLALLNRPDGGAPRLEPTAVVD